MQKARLYADITTQKRQPRDMIKGYILFIPCTEYVLHVYPCMYIKVSTYVRKYSRTDTWLKGTARTLGANTQSCNQPKPLRAFGIQCWLLRLTST